MESFEQCFEAVSDYCRDFMSETSHNLFIKSLEPETFSDGVASLLVSSDFKRNTIEERYLPLLREGFARVLGFEVEVLVRSRESMGAHSPIQTLPVAGDTLYTFDNFVVGPGNRFAHAATKAVAENPSGAYNPLFIYGESGLGKTHLLMAIKSDLAVTRPDFKVTYVEGERFTNELIASIRSASTEEFRDRYRAVDVLLMDDVHFIGGKESTMEEFFHTFNALHKSGKQIVLTSDRPPKDIKSLTDRLRTRFESGLIADIAPPEFETRVSILQRKAEQLGYPLPDDVAEYIADHLKDNIRQLEGIVKKLYAYRLMDNLPPTVANAQAAVKDIMKEQRPLPVTVDKIIDEVSRTFGIAADDIRSSKRDADIASARQISMYVMREVTPMTMEDIGDQFGGRNHSTVTHSLKKVQHQLSYDTRLREMVGDIIKNCKT